MTDKEFLLLLQETLNRESPLDMKMRLEDLPEWDSLSAMAVVGMAERYFGKPLKLTELGTVGTVEDLYALLA